MKLIMENWNNWKEEQQLTAIEEGDEEAGPLTGAVQGLEGDALTRANTRVKAAQAMIAKYGKDVGSNANQLAQNAASFGQSLQTVTKALITLNKNHPALHGEVQKLIAIYKADKEAEMDRPGWLGSDVPSWIKDLAPTGGTDQQQANSADRQQRIAGSAQRRTQGSLDRLAKR